MGESDQAIVDKLEMVWASIDELCSSLTDEDWSRPTDCTGWDVKDNLSHIIGTEASLLGRPAPEHTPANTDHVRNEIGHANEVQVDFRRPRQPSEVLDEFREVTSARLEQLRGWGPEDFEKESWTPVGPGTVRDFLGIRVFDCWVHEQDIRRAVGRPGHLQGPVADHGFERIASAMPFVVGKKVAPPNGTIVQLDIGTRTIGIDVEGGKARRVEAVPGEPTVRLAMDLEAFTRLGCGRGDPAVAGAGVEIEGDEELGRRILSSMNFMI